jgi:hypothetical protein
MSFGLHLFLAIVWLLITLVVLGFGIYGLIIKIPLLAVACFALVAIDTVFIISDIKTLFLHKK